jgi:L-ascorbate metabolism protein UlaG (beta-lactamase superfamily)
MATPARHFSSRTLRDRNHSLWSGFLLEIAGHRLFFAGDSGAGRHWAEIGQRLGAPDLALLPIGAYEPRSIMAPVHMNPAEAVAAHQALGAAQSVGMHFGTFQLTDEPIDAPPAVMAAARAAAGLADTAFVTLGFGETRLFPW